jgi:hypothetical protein
MKEGKTYDLHIYTGVELLFYLSFALKDNGVFFKRQFYALCIRIIRCVVRTKFDIYVLIGTSTAVHTGDVSLVVSANTSPFSEMLRFGV